MRNNPISKKEHGFHDKFKKWINSIPPLTEQEWQNLIEEDMQHLYSAYPTTNPSEEDNLREEENSAAEEQVVEESVITGGTNYYECEGFNEASYSS